MRKTWAVIRREFVERVRTRAFILATILGPVFFAIMFILPGYLMSRDTGVKRIAVVDGTTSEFGTKIAAALTASRSGQGAAATQRYAITRVPAAGREIEVRDSLVRMTGLSKKTAEGFEGLLLVSDSSLVTGRLHYLGANVGSFRDVGELEGVTRRLVVVERLTGIGIDPAEVMKSQEGIDLVTAKVADGKLTGESGAATFFLAYAMGIILYISLLIFGSQVMTSIVEEKTSRIVEVLASSLTPFQMMLGKVVGVGLVALVQIGIWTGAATLFSTYKDQIMSALGVAASGPLPLALPSMSPDLFVVFLIFFGLGFLLYAAAYAAIGAMCNTTQDAQQLQFPVMMFVIAGFFSVFALIRDPNGTAAQVLSYVPPMAPFVVPMRYSISPLPWTALAGTILTTILGMLLIIWIASRIYRVGILMYGKRASFREVFRWVRAG
jgi:ABC-2 type transport system permease protein